MKIQMLRNSYSICLLLPFLALLGFTAVQAESSGLPSIKESNFYSLGPDSLQPEVYRFAEEMPRFPGCEEKDIPLSEKKQCATQKLLEFIYSEIKYPEEARKQEITGMSVGQFIVEKDGSLSNIKIIRGNEHGFGKEVIRTLNLINERKMRWVPGKQNGKKVRILYNIPVKFHLKKNNNRSQTNTDKTEQREKGQNQEPPTEDMGGEKNEGSSEPLEKEIFQVAEEMPRFPGCEEQNLSLEEKKNCAQKRLLEFIHSELQYPKLALEKEVQGIVVVRFVIEKDGSLKNIRTLRDIGAGCGDEAVRVVESMNEKGLRWVPGKYNGENVRIQYNLPVRFELPKNKPDTIPNVNKTDPAKTDSIHQDSEPGKREHSTDFANQEIFKVVEEMPRFPGCEEKEISLNEKKKCAQDKLLDFIYNELQYPDEARKNKIAGNVVVQFIVEPDGTLSNVQNIREIGGGCGDEAVRVVESMNEKGLRWIPGKQRGRKVRVQFNLPVRFKLPKKNLEIRPDKSEKSSDVPSREIFKVVEEMPRFPGCEKKNISLNEKKKCAQDKLLDFIYNELQYPEKARKYRAEGRVLVGFIVETNGTLSNVHIVRDNIGLGCGDEAIRVVELMKKKRLRWTPGKQGGKRVRVKLNFPVEFKL